MHRLNLIKMIPLWLFALTMSAETTVTAIFNPPRIAMGDEAQYVVEIKETSSDQLPKIEEVTTLPIPHSGGLSLTNGRTSSGQQTRISNGKAEYSVTQQLIIDAKAPSVGSFTIPGYTFEYKGRIVRAPSATLEVVERPADAGPTTDELIFLEVDSPDQLYVGQTTTIVLKLYTSEDMRLTGLNRFDRSADGFTISELPDSREAMEIFKGRRYIVRSWPLTITPIQTGMQDLNFQFDVAARSYGSNNSRDPFGRSLFDNFLGRSERFTVYTEPTQIEVLSLPSEGQPDSFTGAIGDFAMQVYTDLKETKVGEPIMLSIEISGQGNFDRINGPEVPETDDWRSYDPESSFEARSPEDSQRGSKRFDYVMIPQTAGDIETPEIRFAYFDPETKEYSELSSPPIQVQVSQSNNAPIQSTPTTQSPVLSNTALPLQQELSIEEALLTLDYQPSEVSSHRYLLADPKFWLFNVFAAFALIFTCLGLRKRRRLKEDPVYAAQQAAKVELRAAVKDARQSLDTASFYRHAQNVVRLEASCRTQQNLRSANINELNDHLTKTGTHSETLAQIRTLFETADAHRFSGATSDTDLATAKTELERILKAL